MEELNQIVQKMIDAGESESNIKLVIESYKPQEELAKTNDSASADPAVESNQNSTGSESVNGSLEPRNASDFANTQEENIWLEDYFGKNELTDFIGDLWRAGSSGVTAGSSVDESFDLYKKGKDMTDDELKAFLSKTREIEKSGRTDEMIALTEKQNQLKKEGYNGVSAFFLGWWDNPSAMLQYSVQSLAQMGTALVDSEEVRGTATASAGAGALGGAAVGSVFGGIGAAPGAVTGMTAGFFGGLSGAMEVGMTTAQLMQEQAEKEGLNWGDLSDKERFNYVRELTNDTEKFGELKSNAVARGIAIGSIDALTAGLTAGVGGSVYKGVASTAKSALANTAKTGTIAAIETTGGLLSEVAGQAAAGQEFNLEEILIEGFADKTFTGASIINSAIQGGPKYSINGEKMNGKQFIDNIKILDDEAFVLTDGIKVENSPAVNKLISDRRQNIAADQDVDSRINKPEDRTTAINLVKEQNKLKNNPKGNKTRLTQIQIELDNIAKPYENSEVDVTIEQRKQGIAAAVDTKFEAEFNKNFKALDDAKDVTGQEPVLFEDDKSYLDAVEKVFGAESRVKAAASDGVFAGDGKVFINKAKAKRSIDIATGNNGAISVTSHEVLHPIFNALIGGVKEQGSFVKDFRKKMTTKQKAYVSKALKERDYSKAETATELMNVFSDGIVKGDINYEQTFFEKIGDSILGLFKKQGLNNMSFDNGKDVYNFLKEYNTSIKEGKLSDKAIATIKTAESKEGATKVADAKLLQKKQFSKSVAEAEAALDEAIDADPNNPSYLDNIDKAEAELDAAEEAAKNPVKEVVAEKPKPKPKPKSKVARPEKPTRTTDLGPRDPLSQKIMDTYNEGMEGVERTDYKASKPLPSLLERKLVPMFEGYINTIVQQKFKQFATEALEFQDALSILRAEVSNAIRTYNPAKNKDLAGYVKKIIQTRQSLMFKDANAEFAASLDDAKGVIATEDTQSIDRSGTVERGQATFDELDIVDDTLIEDIKQDIEKEIRVRVQKGTLSEMISVKKGRDTYMVSWLENYVNKQLFKKLSKKLGAIKGVYPDAVIPGAYIDFLNDPKTFDIITKALPIKSIKKSYGKLFPIEKVGRELTAEGNPVFRIKPIDKKTFLTYFVKGNKSTVLERQKQLFREILEPLAKQVVADYATLENLSELKSIQELAPEQSIDVVSSIALEAQLNNLESAIDRYKGESTNFDIIQFSKTKFTENEKVLIKKASNTKAVGDLATLALISRIIKSLISPTKTSLKTKFSQLKDELGVDLYDKFYDGFLAPMSDAFSIMQDIKEHGSGIAAERMAWDVFNSIPGIEMISKKPKGNPGDRRADIVIKIKKLNKTIKIEVKANKSARITTYEIKDYTTNNPYTSRAIGETNEKNTYDSIANSKVIQDTFKRVKDYMKKNKIKEEDYINSKGEFLLTPEQIDLLLPGTLYSNSSVYMETMNESIVENIFNDKDVRTIGFLDLGMFQIGNEKSGFNLTKLKGDFKVRAWFNKRKITKAGKHPISLRAVVEMTTDTGNKLAKASSVSMVSKVSVKRSIMQASKTNTEINKDFNNIIEGATGIKGFKTFSEAKGKVRGQNKGKYKFFIPPSADDFAGLMSRLLGKNKQGDLNAAWFKDNLFNPFAKGIRNFEAYKEQSTAAVKALKSRIKKIPNGLNKVNDTGFTNEVAVRTYLWAKNGHEISGLSATDQKDLIKIVENNSALKEFADELNQTFQGYPEPTKEWLAGSITIDMINMINTSKRAEFLQEWQEKVDVIFSKDNMNKLRAAYGDNYIEALEDMLYRMRTGRNRPSGANKLTNKFMNWVNDSVGTIMFFNTRSALLQTLSIANFINWQENNPAKAAMAFANQKQFWSDFAMLFNSDFLKQRRSGLKNDINADEIAAAAETATNKTKAVLNSILKAGFLPTQMADSFAIAMGGASFIRNRINKYVSEGMDVKAAEEQSFLDFQEIAEETQQSSRPDRISQQQASPLGRIILAFANTPMQYMRLTKKAFLDLKNGRGDAKTNISKIVYYTVLQNIIFSSLQSALFAAAFEDVDDDELKDKEIRIANSMLDSILRGLGIYGAIASTGKNIILEIKKQSDKSRPDFTQAALRSLDLSPPISSKVRKLMSTGRAFSYKNVRDKMTGYGLDNPAFYALGQTVSAVTNVPLDRAIKKADNIRVAMDNDTKLWQSIALALGYSQWDLGLVETSSSKKTKNKSKKRTLKRRTLKRRTLNRK